MLMLSISFNEKERLAEHYVRFNVPELMRTAAAAVGRDRCVKIVKDAEGGFNKIYLLTMDDGYEVIARIPTPIAGPAHYTTASEVAAMDLLRTKLDIPVPKVFAWASWVDGENTVGAEYVIMEKILGETLASRWPSLSKKQIFAIIKQIVDIECRLFSTRFPKYGSLYYKADLEEEVGDNEPTDQDGADLLSDRFSIGPIADMAFWRTKRDQLKINRGPWTRAQDYLTSISNREAAWTAQYGRPRRRQFFFSCSEHEIEPKDHISLLSQYNLLVPHIIPKQEDLISPTLRHPDLNKNNILLRPNSTDILGIIDWQGTSTLPCFLRSGFPSFCDRPPDRPAQPLERPKLPEDFEGMSLEEQGNALMELRREQASLCYAATTGLKCERHLAALRRPYLPQQRYLVRQAGMHWGGDLVNLRAAITSIYSKWDEFVGEEAKGTCPVSFTDEEVRSAEKESEEWNEAAEMITTLREVLGIDEEGDTFPENFDRAMALNKEFRIQMLREAKVEGRELCWQIWPFKDDDDDSTAPTIA